MLRSAHKFYAGLRQTFMECNLFRREKFTESSAPRRNGGGLTRYDTSACNSFNKRETSARGTREQVTIRGQGGCFVSTRM